MSTTVLIAIAIALLLVLVGVPAACKREGASIETPSRS
jgi:hypothetical protein